MYNYKYVLKFISFLLFLSTNGLLYNNCQSLQIYISAKKEQVKISRAVRQKFCSSLKLLFNSQQYSFTTDLI